MKTRSLCAGAFRALLISAAAAILAACASPLDNRAEGTLRIVLPGGASSGERAAFQENDVPAAIPPDLSYTLVFSGPGGEFTQILEPGTLELTLTLALGDWIIRAEAFTPDGVFYGSGEFSVTVTAGGPNEAVIIMKRAFAQITAFSFADLPPTTIDPDTKTVTLTVPFGTDVTGLVPTIEFEGAAIEPPLSDEPQDFTAPVIYTVTAANGDRAEWTVTVTVALPRTDKDITAFSFADPAATGVPDPDTKAIAVRVPFNTVVTNLIPEITVSPGAAVSPASGEARDFTDPVAYTVTAEDGSTAEWTVTVTIAPNYATDITGFRFDGLTPPVAGTVDAAGKTIAVEVPYGTDRNGLVPTVTHLGQSISPASGAARDFNGPVAYTVTAWDGSIGDWTVTVAVAFNTAKDITEFRFDDLTAPAVGIIAGTTITVTVPYGVDRNGLPPVIAVSPDASVSPASGAARDFTGPVAYTVTAQDGSTAEWTVTVHNGPYFNKGITSFVFAALPATGVVNAEAKTIAVTALPGTVLTGLVPTISVFSPNTTTVSPASGAAQDFGSPVAYVVTATDGSTETWTVTVTAPDSFNSVALIRAYLASAVSSGPNPIPLPAALNLADTNGEGWADLLGAIDAAAMYVALDLSACVMGGTVFDPVNSISAGKSRILSLVLPKGAASIAAGGYDNDILLPSFRYFTGLAGVAGAGITGIGEYAFYGCSSLKSMDFSAVITIGNYAFYRTGLTAVTLPASLTSLGQNPFAGCAGLTAVTVDDGNPGYKHSSDKRMLLSKDGETLVSYPAATGAVTLSDSIIVGDYAFQDCAGLTAITLSSATSVGYAAFYGCAALTTAEFPAAASIGSYAFAATGTTALTVALGATVPALGPGMFSGVDSAKSVTVTIPFGMMAWSAIISAYDNNDTAANNWGNAFRGKGWDGSVYKNGPVNGSIVLAIERLNYLVVSQTGSNDTGDGSEDAPYATVDTALARIAAVYADPSSFWPGKGTASAKPARIRIDGKVTEAAGVANGMVNISDTVLYTTYPPIILEGTGTLDASLLSPLRVLYIEYAHVTLRESLTLTGGNASDGGGVYVNSGTFAMSGGTISGNEATTGNGGGVTVAGGEFEMSAGTISNNHAALSDGGGVAVGIAAGNSPVFTMSGGIITGNTTASDGGGVAVAYNGTFAMSVGTIIGNTVSANGGGVSVKGSGTFKMSGGASITAHEISGNGGGVYVAGGTFEMSKNAAVSGNEASRGGGVYFNGKSFKMSGGKIGGNTDDEANSAIHGGGVYVYGGTFEMDGTAAVSRNTATTGYGGGVYFHANAASFTIFGNVAVSGNKAGNYGGGVYFNGTNFTMSGGKIGGSTDDEANSAVHGGGVAVGADGGTFKMSGTAAVSGNSVNGNGGGVYFNGTSFKMSGGEIGGDTDDEANSAGNGGGVYVAGGTFELDGTAAVSRNQTTGSYPSNGGGVAVAGGTFKMSEDAAVSRNTATTGNGGGVYVTGAGTSFTMSGGKIGGDTDDKANSAANGGGVYMGNGSTFTMNVIAAVTRFSVT
jgi:hypothetical protein